MRPITDISQVYSGGTVTVNMPLGSTYHQVQFLRTNMTRAQCENVQVIIGSKVVQEYATLQELYDINAFHNRPQSANYDTFWFDRPELDPSEREVTAIGTLDVSSFQIKFKVNVAAISPALEVNADRSIGTPLGAFVKVKRNEFALTSSGQVMLPKLSRVGHVIAEHFHKAADDITEIRIARDDVDQLQSTTAKLEEYQAQYGKVPQALYVHNDYCIKGSLDTALQVDRYADGAEVQEYFAQVTVGTAATVTVISEHIDGLSGA